MLIRTVSTGTVISLMTMIWILLSPTVALKCMLLSVKEGLNKKDRKQILGYEGVAQRLSSLDKVSMKDTIFHEK